MASTMTKRDDGVMQEQERPSIEATIGVGYREPSHLNHEQTTSG
jgi:hypothetical protein